MLFFAAAAIAAMPAQTGVPTAVPSLQATATVHIVSGARLSFGKARAGEGFKTRDTVLRTAGSSQAARLIEFE